MFKYHTVSWVQSWSGLSECPRLTLTGKKALLTFRSEIFWIGKNLKKKNPLNSFELVQSRKSPTIDL